MALPKLYPPDEAGAVLGQKVSTLAVWRCIGRGPAWIRVGRKIFYTEQALETYLRKQTRVPKPRKARAA